ncbi:MAG: universal stress protein [Nitrospiraceae bacterium]|nr:MAG: universal stress protein [Nitrospiraceae bacterium]
MKKILIAHDGSKSSEKALKKAFEIAEKFGSSVTVISVVPELYLTELMEVDRIRILETLTEEAKKTMDRIRTKTAAFKRVRTIITQGNPAEEVLDTAKKIKADLIVTGSHGRHGAQRFLLGSVSSKIIDHAECAVLVVK